MSNKKLEEIKNLLNKYKEDIYKLIKQNRYNYAYKITNIYSQELYNLINIHEKQKETKKELTKEDILKLLRKSFPET